MKRYRVIWDDKAKSELRDIYEYLKNDANVLQAAVRVRKELTKMTASLQTMPMRYKVYEYADKEIGDYRSVVRWHYRIIYAILDKEVHIVRIVHTSSAPDSIKL